MFQFQLFFISNTNTNYALNHKSFKSFKSYAAELFSIVENRLYSYAEDSTLVALVPSPGERVAVLESVNRDINWVSVCVTRGE